MRNWSKWRQAAELPRRSYVRRTYRRRHRGWDPLMNLVLMAIIIALQITCTYLAFRLKWYESNYFFLAFLSMIGSIGIFLTIVLCIILWSRYTDYTDLMAEVADILELHVIDLDDVRQDKLLMAAKYRLRLLARNLQNLEKERQSYFPEVIAARNRFDRAYQIFLQAGLIPDTGWKPYFS